MQSSLPTRRMRRTQGLLGALLVTLLVALVLAGCGHTTASARTSQATPTITAPPATPSPLVTPTPTVPLVVSDAQEAQAVSFAYVQNNDVWVSLHGAQPRQMTHVGLDPQAQLAWILIWSPDASQLLASESPFTSQGQAWLISLSNGTVSPFPPLCLGPCWWLGERYIVYPAGGGTHYMQVQLYDIQQRRAVPTALDAQQVVNDLETRESSVYFTPYPMSPPPTPQDGLVKRFDLATNAITAAYTLPGPVIIEGIPLFGAWDLSADGSRLVAAFGNPSTEHCPQSGCYTYFRTARAPCHQSSPRISLSKQDLSPR